MTDSITVSPFVLVCAFRYALGRRTYAVQMIAETLIGNRDRLPESDRELIVREIRETIARGFGGGECDVADWRRVADALTDDVPPRVLAAEERRDFAQLMARSSLGCPNRVCEHGIGSHDADDYESDGAPVRPICSVPGCSCGGQWRDR